MEQSPSWETNRFSCSQEMPRILWNPKFHYRFHNCPPSVPLLSQIKPFHTLSSHFLKIHLNSILASTFGSSKWSLFLRLPTTSCMHLVSPHSCYMRHPHHSWFYHTNNIWWRAEIIKLLVRSSPLPRLLIPLRRKYPPQRPFSNSLGQRSSLNVGDPLIMA
jgi:hypothetical protein